MNPFEAISFVVDDEHWLGKLALAAVWALLIPVLVGWWLLFGWSVEIMRRTLRGEAHPLPGWRPFWPLLRDGLRGCLTYLVYSLPFFVLEAGAWALRTFVGGAAAGVATGLGVAAAIWLVLSAFYMQGVMLVLARGGGLRDALNLGQVRELLRDNATSYQLAFIAVLVFAPLLTLGGALFLGLGALVGLGWSFALAGRLYAQAYLQAQE